MARTTINIKREIREALKKKRKYARETYDDVLERMLSKDLKKGGLKLG